MTLITGRSRNCLLLIYFLFISVTGTIAADNTTVESSGDETPTAGNAMEGTSTAETSPEGTGTAELSSEGTATAEIATEGTSTAETSPEGTATAEPSSEGTATAEIATEMATMVGTAPEETTRVSIATTTADPCESCDTSGLVCPKECGCGEDLYRPPFNTDTCAEPCENPEFWCPLGEECTPDSEGHTCSCPAGYYNDAKIERCVLGKFFGGEITFVTIDKKNESSEKTIEEILEVIYGDGYGFQSAKVLRSKDTEKIITYQLTYNSSGDREAVEASFYEVCPGDANTTDANITGGFVINCTASSETFLEDDILCEYGKNECDNQTAECNYTDGSFSCRCLEGYHESPYSSTSCLKNTTSPQTECSEHGDCNTPFGWCTQEPEPTDSVCECMWGFTGESCKNSWEFTFTIVTAVLGVILIIVLILLICSCTRTKSKKASQMQEDLNLKNPFVDFQPGLVRAKAPAGMFSISDSIDNRESNGYSAVERNSYYNGGYSHASEIPQKKHSTFHAEYQTASLSAPGKSNGAEYF